jgi:hypothetical protein
MYVIHLLDEEFQRLLSHSTDAGWVDATNASVTSFNWTCPDVKPPAQIYFYQFSSPYANTSGLTTDRFTIAAADGSTESPSEVQPPGQLGGPPVLWGNATINQAVRSTPSSVPGTPPSTSRSSGSSSTPAMTTGTAPVAAPSDISSDDQVSATRSASNLAGIVAGTIAGVLILSGAGIWLFLRSRRRRRGLLSPSQTAAARAHMENGSPPTEKLPPESVDVQPILDHASNLPNLAHRFFSPTGSPHGPFGDEHAVYEHELGDGAERPDTVRDGVLSIPDPAGAAARLSQGLAFAKLALEAEEAARAACAPSRVPGVSAHGLPVTPPGDGPGGDLPEVEMLRLELERVRAERDAERARSRELALASGDVPPAYCAGGDGAPGDGTGSGPRESSKA